MNTTLPNGRPQRKQLSDQLDRLDGIIDTLAEGLNGAVADAAREGSRQAVKEIVTELLTNPDILSMIRTAALGVVPTPAKPSEPAASSAPANKPAGMVASTISAVVGSVSSAVRRVTSTVYHLWTNSVATVSAVRHNPQLQKMLLVGTSVGLAAAFLATTNHTVAATLSGLGAAATAISMHALLWVRGARRRLGLS